MRTRKECIGSRSRGAWAWIVVAAAGLCLAARSEAAVEMPGLFSDHMVLQRDMPVPVWGKATPGEKVRVSFRGQSKETVGDSSGRWMVRLDPMKAESGQKPGILVVEGENRIEFADVLVGEVWLGSGQSNMVWPIYSCKDADKEDEAANEPMIRFSCNNLWPSYETPNSGWLVCKPGHIRRFSALMYGSSAESVGKNRPGMSLYPGSTSAAQAARSGRVRQAVGIETARIL